jgi:Ca2+-binding EF-hand superfamily protein/chromosome segregation ATPase
MNDTINLSENSSVENTVSPAKGELVRSRSLNNLMDAQSQQSKSQEEHISTTSTTNENPSTQYDAQLNPEKIKELRATFEYFDEEKTGKLNKSQFRKFVESADVMELTDEQFDTIFSHFETDSNGCITFENFINGVEKWMKAMAYEQERPPSPTFSQRNYLHSLLSPRIDSLRRTVSFRERINSKSETNSPIKPLIRRLELPQNPNQMPVNIAEGNFHRKLSSTESIASQISLPSQNDSSLAHSSNPRETATEVNKSSLSQGNFTTTSEPKMTTIDLSSNIQLLSETAPTSIPTSTTTTMSASDSRQSNLSLPSNMSSSLPSGSRLNEEKRVAARQSRRTQTREIMKRIFKQMDQDNDGLVSFSDVKNYMLAKNMSFNEEEVMDLFDEFVPDDIEKLPFDTFAKFWPKASQLPTAQVVYDDEVEPIDDYIQTLKFTITRLESMKIMSEAKLKDARAQNEAQQKEIKELKSKLEEYEKMKHAQNETKALQAELEVLKQEREKQQLFIDSLAKKKKELEFETESLKGKLSASATQISDLQQSLENLEQQLANKFKVEILNVRKERDLLQKQLENLQKELDEYQDYKRFYERERIVTAEKTKTIELLDKQLSEIQNNNLLQIQQISKLHEHITQLDTQIKQLIEDKRQLSEENRQLLLQLKQLDEKISQNYATANSQDENVRLVEEIKKLKEEIATIQKEKERIAASSSHFEQELVNMKQLFKEKENTIQRLRKEVEEIKSDNETKEKQIEFQTKQSEDNQTKLTQIEKEVEKLKDENLRLREEYNELQSKYIKIQENHQKERQLNQQLIQKLQSDLNTQKQKFEDEMMRTLSQMNALSSQLHILTTENEKLSKRLTELEKEKGILLRQCQESESKVKQLEAQIKQLSDRLQQRHSDPSELLPRTVVVPPGFTIYHHILVISFSIFAFVLLLLTSRFFARHLWAT